MSWRAAAGALGDATGSRRGVDETRRPPTHCAALRVVRADIDAMVLILSPPGGSLLQPEVSTITASWNATVIHCPEESSLALSSTDCRSPVVVLLLLSCPRHSLYAGRCRGAFSRREGSQAGGPPTGHIYCVRVPGTVPHTSPAHTAATYTSTSTGTVLRVRYSTCSYGLSMTAYDQGAPCYDPIKDSLPFALMIALLRSSSMLS